jgi:hypothetical protein
MRSIGQSDVQIVSLDKIFSIDKGSICHVIRYKVDIQ